MPFQKLFTSLVVLGWPRLNVKEFIGQNTRRYG